MVTRVSVVAVRVRSVRPDLVFMTATPDMTLCFVLEIRRISLSASLREVGLPRM